MINYIMDFELVGTLCTKASNPAAAAAKLSAIRRQVEEYADSFDEAMYIEMDNAQVVDIDARIAMVKL